MTTTAKTRKSIEDRIAEAQAKVKALKEAKKKQAEKKKEAKKKPVVLKKDSPGIAELLTHIDAVATQNKVKVSELIKKVAGFKRTGLVIGTKKTKVLDLP